MSKRGHECEVDSIPNCDVCKMMFGKEVAATHDAKTILGPWAFVCDLHWKTYGPGRTGTGMGQKLILRETT